MKIISGFTIFCVVIFVTSCFDPPEFPTVPQISFNDIVFYENPNGSDSLVLSIDFKDGDGDLGIDAQNPAFISDPFNNTNFFQTNNGKLSPLHTYVAMSGGEQYEIIDIPDPNSGKLVTFRTQKDPLYDSLPSTFHCSSYEILADRANPANPPTGRKILIEKADLPALEPMVEIVDTLFSETNEFYQIRDTLAFMLNPDHYNISVEFFYLAPGHEDADNDGFVKFDWFKDFCITFDGRFPVLTDKNNTLEGTLRYAMISEGFLISFSIRTLKLKIHIKDRALNKSNVVETRVFTLDDIRPG